MTDAHQLLKKKRYGVAARGFDTNRGQTNALPAGGSANGGDFSGQPAPTNLPDKVAAANAGFGISTDATENGQDFDGCKTAFLKCSDLNTCVAETPSQVSNKLFAGLGYVFKKWDNPLMLGLGGSYEWANSAAISGWAVWGKIGIGF